MGVRICEDWPVLTEPCTLHLQEMQRSRRVRKDPNGQVTYELVFICWRTDSERLVRCRVEDPTIGIYVQFRAANLITYQLEPAGGGVWYVYATYGMPQRNTHNTDAHVTEPPSNVSLTIGTRAVTVKEAVHQRYFNDAPDVGNAINVSGDDVKGAQVSESTTRFSEVWTFPWNEVYAKNVSNGVPGGTYERYLDAWAACVGRTNAGKFREFEAEEVLLYAINGRNLGDWQLEVTFEFEVRITRSIDLPEKGGGGTATLQGWDFLWYIYEKDDAEGTEQRKLMLPRFAYAAQVYETADFLQLGIGTSGGYMDPSYGGDLKPFDPCSDDGVNPPIDWEVDDPRYGDYDKAACATPTI